MYIPKVALGRTGLSVSRIGCGLMRIGRKWGIDTPGNEALPDQKAAFTFLREAVELGINFFDTAPAYGTSEAVLGQFLSAHPDLAREMIIATKCGMLWRDDGTTPQDFLPESMRQSVENSLRLLGGHLHLLQLHSINMEVLSREESLRVLEDFQQQGDVDFIGTTCTRPPEAAVKAATLIGRFDTLQVQYNPLDQSMAKAINTAGGFGLGVIVNRPLATGVLSSKVQFASDPKQREAARQIQAQSGAADLAAYSWEFIFSNPSVTLALTGTRDIEHLKENLRALKALKPQHVYSEQDEARAIEAAGRVGLSTRQIKLLINAFKSYDLPCFALFPSAFEALAEGGFTADQIFEFVQDVLKRRNPADAFTAMPAVFIDMNMSSLQYFELTKHWEGEKLHDNAYGKEAWSPYSLGRESNYKFAALPFLLKAKLTLKQIFMLLKKTESRVDDGTPGNEGAYDAYGPAVEAALKIDLSSEYIFRLLNKYLEIDLMPAYGFQSLPPLFEAANEVGLPHGEMVDLAEKTTDLFIRNRHLYFELVDVIPLALRAGWTPEQIMDLFARIEAGSRNSEIKMSEDEEILIRELDSAEIERLYNVRPETGIHVKEMISRLKPGTRISEVLVSVLNPGVSVDEIFLLLKK